MRKIWMVFVIVLVCGGCKPFSMTTRVQQPLYHAPSKIDVAIVMIDTGASASTAPQSFRDVKKNIVTAIKRAFRETSFHFVDRTASGGSLSIYPTRRESKDSLFANSLNRPSSMRQRALRVYKSKQPKLPVSIKEQWCLGVKVLRWGITRRPDPRLPGRSLLQAHIDIVYALWGRGRHVETRRIVSRPVGGDMSKFFVRSIPVYPYWLWWGQRVEYRSFAPSKRDNLFRYALRANAFAFAWPFGRRKVSVTAVWDNSSPFVKPGIELAKEKQYQAAYDAWKDVLAQRPSSLPALRNLAVVCEVLGKEKEALAFYKRANKIKKEGYYTGRQKSLRLRLQKRVSFKVK